MRDQKQMDLELGPEGFEQLNVRGDFIRLNPLPKVPEEIASKGVRKIGGNANLSAG